jgi:hypothetical protein
MSLISAGSISLDSTLKGSQPLERQFYEEGKNGVKISLEGGFYSFSPFYNAMFVPLYILVHYSAVGTRTVE